MKINTLSDIFGDRVPGSKKPAGIMDASISQTEEQVIENVKQKEFKTNFFDKEVPGVSLGGSSQFDFFDSVKTNKIDEMLKMPKTNIKKPSFSGYDSMFKGVNVNGTKVKKPNFKNFDNLFKKTNVKANLLMSPPKSNFNKKLVDFGIDVPKVKKPSGFKGKLNFYLSNGTGEKKAWALLNRHPEKVALNRIKQQKFLSPLGDFDMDKKINMLDCNPMNPHQQGVGTKITNWMAGKGFNEDVETPIGQLETYDEQGDTITPTATYMPSIDETTETTVEKDIDVSDIIGVTPTAQIEYEPTVVPGVEEKSPLKKILEFTGIPKRIEEYKEEQKQYTAAKKRGTELGLEYARTQKITDVFEEAKRKAAGIPEKKTTKTADDIWRKRYERDVLGIGRKRTKGLGLYPQFQPFEALAESSQIFKLGTGMTGAGTLSAERLIGLRSTGAGVYSSLGLGLEQGLPFDVKVDSWFGKGERMKQMAEMPQRVQSQPVQPTQAVAYAPTPTYQPTPRAPTPSRGPPPQPGMVWSPYSKRYVRYPRGPYRKPTY